MLLKPVSKEWWVPHVIVSLRELLNYFDRSDVKILMSYHQAFQAVRLRVQQRIKNQVHWNYQSWCTIFSYSWQGRFFICFIRFTIKKWSDSQAKNSVYVLWTSECVSSSRQSNSAYALFHGVLIMFLDAKVNYDKLTISANCLILKYTGYWTAVEVQWIQRAYTATTKPGINILSTRNSSERGPFRDTRTELLAPIQAAMRRLAGSR